MVALHAEDGRVDQIQLCAVLLEDTLANAVDGGLTGVGIANDSAFADVGATGFELGFDEDDDGASPWFVGVAECTEDCGDDERSGDERDVHGDEDWRGCAEGEEFAGGEETGVGAFAECDARVVAELLGDLTVAGVDCQDGGGAALEHAVGEAAGGGSNVDAGEIREVDLPVGESSLKFEAATTDVFEIGAEEANDGVG